MDGLLIVSNRLPVVAKLEHGQMHIHNSSGGLATALKGPHEQGDSIWIGWPGDVKKFDEKQLAKLEENLSQHRLSPVYLTHDEIKQFYEGFSNGVLWPLYHYLSDKVDLDAWVNWKAFVEVNQKFATQVIKQYKPGNVIWIHDYQLSLLPGMLRKLLPEAKIGFFLHIPFPSSEVFRILPWRLEILEGMLGADLIGFHTYSYVRHFSTSLLHLLDIAPQGNHVFYANREIKLGAFPIGIDVGFFDRLAKDDDVVKEVELIKSENPGRKLLLGVDRLDYTKGIVRRLLAVERFLEREPKWHGKIRFIQVVVPSRGKVDAYDQLRQTLDGLVGRINGAYGSVISVPIHYLYKSLSEKQLVALYLATDLMLVSPLRDGMNLVAKEFVASRIDEDGVLLLSEFAGASVELVESLIFNPYDVDRFSLFINKALTMSQDERQTRMRDLRRRVQAFDSHRWAETFIEALVSCSPGKGAGTSSFSSDVEQKNILDRIRQIPQLVLLLDYDGTLISFAETPDLAVPDPEILELVLALSKRHDTRVHIVSGRSKESLERWFGNLPIGLHAEHGFWSRFKPIDPWNSQNLPSSEWKMEVKKILDKITMLTPGSLIEEKSASIAWHYRKVEPEFAAQFIQHISDNLEKEFDKDPLEVIHGEKVIEIRLKGIHKGSIIPKLLSEYRGFPCILAMGDDRTDEDMFSSLPPGGICIHVGSKPSIAPYRLPDVAAARTFLKKLLD